MSSRADISLCLREARRSRNGPPPRLGTRGERARAPAPATGAGRRACGRAREPGRALRRQEDKRRRAPSSSGGTDTTNGSSRQPAPRTPKAETPEPLEPHRRPDPATTTRLPPPYLPSSRVASNSSPHPAHTPHPCLPDLPYPDPPCRRPASRHPSFPPGLPRPVLPGRSRKWGPARSGGPHFLAKPRREAKETPEGGAAACCAQGRNP